MFINRIYYHIKPFIPRQLQIYLRQRIVQGKRKLYQDIWPIDEKAAKKPEDWTGWPDQKRFAFILMHDVDTESGHQKCSELMSIDEEMGFRSSFNFVPERYAVSQELRRELVQRGFEVGVHGLKHDGKLFLSKTKWPEHAARINKYLREWNASGFVSPSMLRKHDWMHDLSIEYDASSFDTDPFEPQPEGVTTIFPFWVAGGNGQKGFVELPYTLSQDFTLYVLMQEKTNAIWKKKLAWIARQGGMALLISHPDYMNFSKERCKLGEYPMEIYRDFLEHVRTEYKGQYWHALPRDMARFWNTKMVR